MRNQVKFLVAAFALLAASCVFAQGKIAVVDPQKAILDTDVAKQKLQALRQDSDYVENKKELERIQKEGQALVQKLKKDGSVMSDNQRAELENRIKEKQSDLKHVAGKLQTAEQGLARELIGQMRDQARTIIADLIKSEGIGLLLDGQAAIHADTSFDITAQVTQKLNAQNK